MKKNLLMTAFLVVTAAFIGCSSDDNLAELQGGDPVPAKGTPMTVTVSDGSGDATRYDNTTTSNIAYFQMWAYNTTNQTDQNTFMTNYGFSKTAANGTKFTNSLANWPATNTDPCFFYAVSENVNNDTDKFGEGFEATGTGKGFTPKLAYELKSTTDIVALPDNGNIASQETTVVDVENIRDFLVCTNTNGGNGITEKEYGSTLSMVFDHALADLEIAARFTSYEWIDDTRETQSVGDECKILINYIAIHGLYTSGTYLFNSKQWDFTGGNRTVYIYKPASPIVVNAQDAITYTTPGNPETATGTAPIKRTTIVPAGKLLIIPQEFISWNPSSADIGAGEAEETPYVEVNVTFEDFVPAASAPDDVDDDGNDNKCSYYIPLQIPNNTFVAGKKHKLLLNLNYIRYNDGEPALAAVGLTD